MIVIKILPIKFLLKSFHLNCLFVWWSSNTLVWSWLTGKNPDAGKDWGQEEKGTMEGDIVAWHHQLNGHEFEQTLRDEGQGSLVCYSPRGCKESEMTKWLNNNNLNGLLVWWTEKITVNLSYWNRFWRTYGM